MGLVSLLQDSIASVSPWSTQIVIDNQCTTPVRVFLARNSEEPSVEDAIDHSVPAQAIYAINSGWLHEPRATLLVRVAVHEAKIYRMSHSAQLKIDLAPHGLNISSYDDIIIEDFPDPGSVPNNDTAPMVLRRESFAHRRPGSDGPRSSSVAQEAVSSPAPTQVQLNPPATVGRSLEAQRELESIDLGIDSDTGVTRAEAAMDEEGPPSPQQEAAENALAEVAARAAAESAASPYGSTQGPQAREVFANSPSRGSPPPFQLGAAGPTGPAAPAGMPVFEGEAQAK